MTHGNSIENAEDLLPMFCHVLSAPDVDESGLQRHAQRRFPREVDVEVRRAEQQNRLESFGVQFAALWAHDMCRQ